MYILSLAFVIAIFGAGDAYCQCDDQTSTATISQFSDADIFTKCSTWQGNVAIATSAPSELFLGPIEVIEGTLVAEESTALSRLEAPNLRTVGGDMRLVRIENLNTVSFPQLSSVGQLLLQELPNLQAVGLDTGINVSIANIQKTQCHSLVLNIKAADQIVIADNQYTSKINIGVGVISQTLGIIAKNSTMVVDLPNLSWAYDVLLNSSAISIPTLDHINGSLTLEGNIMGTFEAPILSVLKGRFEAFNTDIVNISTPELISVGGVQMVNNTHLDTVDLRQLSVIDQDLEIVEGDISALILPSSLRNIGGDVNIITDSDTFDCETLYSFKQKNGIQGKYVCNGVSSNKSNPSSTPVEPSTTPSASSPGSTLPNTSTPIEHLSNGAKAGIGVGAAIGAAGFIGLGAILLLRKRKRRLLKKSSSGWEKPEIDGGEVKREMIVEMGSNQKGAAEMMNGNEAQELQAEHGICEVESATGNQVQFVHGTHEIG